ncbi:T9SS type A sorting domain-containing protein [Flavobacterium paronense]|uniref:T9SS type A sorting domain-containing protein n=1 Tax=Flavobacterium paronense TaxID=1392775 RepID=A0ABV5GFG9_9FLAO|nr:T9SS type A sorting domain-containing protein [Flavobacterium paronense]MDN3676073.1 T9SS type A sorting domain-containing protein [Flavobacterium paronense]
MKTRTLLSLLLLSISLTGFSTTFTITNSGFTFSPSTLNISVGDNVNFVLAGSHNALEISQATWNANGTTPLAGGFQTAFGGGIVSSSQLTVGTHWYICENHAASGMKGRIIVGSLGLPENQLFTNISIFPNPTKDLITIKVSDKVADSAYNIADASGRVVLAGKLSDLTTSIDISQLTNGVYFFQLNERRRQAVKLIKN